jgi:hypothetical protein
MARGGLEGCKPAKNYSFLAIVVGKAGNDHQKIKILSRPGAYTQRVPGASPNPSAA